MAEVIAAFPETGRETKYPWDTWFDGQIWQLTHGVDFETKIETFRQTVAKAAQKRGLSVRTAARKDGDKQYIALQVTLKQPGAPRRRRSST